MMGAIHYGSRGPPMHQSSDVEQLNDRHYVVLLIRASVDAQNRLLGGEVGGPEAFGGPERWVRFQEPNGLAGAVQAWLASRE
jgi:hypothetical protein